VGGMGIANSRGKEKVECHIVVDVVFFHEGNVCLIREIEKARATETET